MDDHAPVLQERVHVAAVRSGGQQAVEGIGCGEQEGEEATEIRPMTPSTRATDVVRQMPGEHRNRRGPEAEDQNPEQQGTLMGTPGGGQAVDFRQLEKELRATFSTEKSLVRNE